MMRQMKKLFLILNILFFIAPAVAANELAVVQAQIKQPEQQQKQIEQKVKVSEKEVSQTKEKLVKAAQKVDKLETERAGLRAKISDLDARRVRLTAEIAANRGHIAAALGGALAVAQNPNFDAEDMREYALTSALLTGISDGLDSEIQAAAAQIKELEEIRDQRAAEQAKLDGTAKKYAAEKKDLDGLLRTRAAQNEKLKNQQYEVQKKLRELSARAKNIAELMAGVGSSAMSGDTKFSARKMSAPVSGKLVSAFADKSALGLVSDGWRIRTRSEALVSAPADGVVKFADSFKGFGRVLIISHKNGYNSVMTGLGKVEVMVGQEVLAGEPVGRMDGDKSEMYLEIRRGASAIAPARLFNEP